VAFQISKYHLEFQDVPSSGYAQSPLSQFLVEIDDSAKTLQTGNSTSTITVGIYSGPSGATLFGTLTAVVNDGIAEFGNVSPDFVGAYILEATGESLSPGQSPTIAVS